MQATSEKFQTPFGNLLIVTTRSDVPVVLAAGFGREAELLNRLQSTRPGLEISSQKLDKKISQAVTDWLDGNLAVFDALRRDQIGSRFRQQCWKAMSRIPPGAPISYAQLAERTDSPRAVRAAATACAQNLIAPIIPCHRVIKSDGSLGRYGYGEATKRKILEFEEKYL